MEESERLALGADRKLIFANVANGVPIEDIMATFHRSSDEIDREVAFVARKIKEYRFRQRIPPLACDTLKDIRFNRLALLDTLRKLGPNYLSSELLIAKIQIQSLDQPAMLREAAQRMQESK